MSGIPLPSSGRRFLQRLGFSLFMAALFGGLVGLLVFHRVPRAQLDEDAAPRTLLDAPSSWLEGLELQTYDWRVRELGARSKRSEDVVVVALDDETLGEARQDDHPGIASHPWPREIVGGVTHRLVDEGAELVLLDFLFAELSPRACLTQGLTSSEMLDDDRSFRALLDRHPGRSVLAFSWSLDRVLPPSSRLWPYRVRLGTWPSRAEALEPLQTVLADQRPAFAIPAGNAVEVWAGVSSEDEGRRVGSELANGPLRVEERRAADDVWRINALDLFVSLAEVQVEGLDSALLPEVRQLQHPIAPLLGTGSLYGGVTVPPDADGLVRAIPHLVSYRTQDKVRHVLPSMPLAAAMKRAGTRKLRYAEGRLFIGERYAIPMDASGFSLVQWDAAEAGNRSRGTVARAIPVWNVLRNLFAVRDGMPPPAVHKLVDKAVVFTNTSSYALDFKPTPVGGKTPGGAILAQSLANILESKGIVRAEPRMDLALTLGLAFLGAFLALTFSSSFRSVTGAVFYLMSLVLVGGAYAGVAWYIFVSRQQWVAIAGPLLALTATFGFATVHAFRTERQLRQFVTGVLGRYVNPDVARLVTRDLSLMRPERRQLTILFSDLVGFTRLSEQLSPEQLVRLLNEYLTEMTAVVRSTGGQVDKYIGDGIMSFWGAPVRTERHAHLACGAALKMQAVLLERQAEWEKAYGSRLAFRIGINSGEVVVGDMGSDLKSNYTVMGDAVNLASRLEGANKAYGTWVLVGDTTVQLAREAFVFREVDRVRVKGKTVATRVHELLGRQGEIEARVQEQLAVYEQALIAYHQRRFQEALASFERGASEFNDAVAATYAGRCRGYLVTPPPEDWEGVHVLEEK